MIYVATAAVNLWPPEVGLQNKFSCVKHLLTEWLRFSPTNRSVGSPNSTITRHYSHYRNVCIAIFINSHGLNIFFDGQP